MADASVPAFAVRKPSYKSNWRISTLDRYLLRLLIGPAFAVLGVTLVAFLLEQTLRLINQLSAAGAKLGYLFGLISNMIPYQLGLAMPAAFFTAMFMVIARLDEESEIDAMLGGGVAFERMVAPFVAMGLVLGVIGLLITGYMQPFSRFGYRAVLNAATDAGWTARLDPLAFINAGPDFTITADEADVSGRGLKGVFIRRQTLNGEFISTAEQGRLGLSDNGKTTSLTLNNGLILSDGPTGPRLLRFEHFSDSEILNSAASIRPRGGDEQELTLSELAHEIGSRDSMIPKRVLQAELYARLVRALAIPLLPLIAMPLAMAAKRGRRAPGMIFGAVVLVAFHHSVSLVHSLASSGSVDPALGLGGLALTVTGFAFWLFLSSRKRPGETPISGFFAMFERFFDRKPKTDVKIHNTGMISLSGYLTRIMTVRTIAAAAALMGLLQLIDLLERTNDILARGGVIRIFYYMAMRTPFLFREVAPFAVLAGAIFTFSQLARNSELIIMRINGLSLLEIFKRTLPVALAVTVIDLVATDQLAPRAEQALATWMKATDPHPSTDKPKPRWFRIDNDVVRLESTTPDGRKVTGVSVYQRDANHALVRRITAADAIPNSGGWKLRDAQVTDLVDHHAERVIVGAVEWRTAFSPDDAQRMFADAYEITSDTAARSLFGKGPLDKSPNQFWTRLYRTLATGAAPLIMLLLALPTALGHTRSNRTLPIIFGLGCGLFYLVVDGLLTAMGQTGVLPPIAAAWGAPIAFAAGAVSLMLYAEG